MAPHQLNLDTHDWRGDITGSMTLLPGRTETQAAGTWHTLPFCLPNSSPIHLIGVAQFTVVV